jgi:hypothetical protein
MKDRRIIRKASQGGTAAKRRDEPERTEIERAEASLQDPAETLRAPRGKVFLDLDLDLEELRKDRR